ncbi:unnamed protein product [Staurois parvus]|uniref:Uncharacterized protein n=1 Tax=Staurois parvus TaxID=386267 RepID=A0ABN9GPQ4_9NEOB|nr:unnamed protein product [Staurois parvus]
MGPCTAYLMLLPGPESLMGPCTASHCCCLHRHTLPMCHFQVSSHWCVTFFVIGCWQITGLPLLLPGPNLPWAPVPSLFMLLPGPECVMGPCTASHCCCPGGSRVAAVSVEGPLLVAVFQTATE